MSQVCTCPPDKVKVVKPEKHQPYCNVCGHWWLPEHGSKLPTNNGVYGGVRRSQSAIGKQLVQANKLAKRHMPERPQPLVGRNDPCTCGSGKKFKKCHGNPSNQPKPIHIPIPHESPKTSQDG